MGRHGIKCFFRRQPPVKMSRVNGTQASRSRIPDIILFGIIRLWRISHLPRDHHNSRNSTYIESMFRGKVEVWCIEQQYERLHLICGFINLLSCGPGARRHRLSVTAAIIPGMTNSAVPRMQTSAFAFVRKFWKEHFLKLLAIAEKIEKSYASFISY